MSDTNRASVDPRYSANIYASGLLDRLIVEAIAPCRQELAQRDDAVRIWAIRYSRRGEHLKVRVHTSLDPAEVDATLRRTVEAFFAGCSESDEEHIARFDVIPIDAEDEGETVVADRQVIQTRYRRSEITLGDTSQLGDATISALYTAMARGFERCLDLPDHEHLEDKRLNLLLRAFIVGLQGAMPKSAADRATYLDYHRNWVLRFFTRKIAKEKELLAGFERRQAALLPALTAMATTDELPPDDPWSLSVHELRRSFETMPDDLVLDPFAPRPGDALLFKLFHGVANNFAVHPFNEAFACHVLAAAARTATVASAAATTPETAEIERV